MNAAENVELARQVLAQAPPEQREFFRCLDIGLAYGFKLWDERRNALGACPTQASPRSLSTLPHTEPNPAPSHRQQAEYGAQLSPFLRLATGLPRELLARLLRLFQGRGPAI